MTTLLMIADDFTGALDTGVKFAQRGASVSVVTNYEYDFAKMPSEVQVLVMDAETRHISAEEAYQRVYRIAKRARAAGITHFYKKTDSALRGNIGSELTAVLDAVGNEENKVLHFIPALPGMGRTTKDGIHYIEGIPVEDSVFGKDPFEPVKCSYIPDMIHCQSNVDVQVIGNGAVLTHSENPMIAVYDARTDRELELIAKALNREKQLTILAGCAGMAQMLPELLQLTGNQLNRPEFAPRFLVACGSVNPITRSQLDYAERHGFFRIRLTPEQKLNETYFHTDVGKGKLREIIQQCKTEPLCILDTNDAPDGPDTLDYARKQGMEIEQVRMRISTTLGYLLKELVEAGVGSTLLITGGDSLLGFMSQVNVCEMTPVCEMAPGTVLSRFFIGGEEYQVISKSGGFGEENLMSVLAEKIIGEKEERALC